MAPARAVWLARKKFTVRPDHEEAVRSLSGGGGGSRTLSMRFSNLLIDSDFLFSRVRFTALGLAELSTPVTVSPLVSTLVVETLRRRLLSLWRDIN